MKPVVWKISKAYHAQEKRKSRHTSKYDMQIVRRKRTDACWLYVLVVWKRTRQADKIARGQQAELVVWKTDDEQLRSHASNK